MAAPTPNIPDFLKKIPFLKPGGGLSWLALAPLLAMFGVCYWWFVQRVEVRPGELLVLVRKTGRDLPPDAAGQIVIYPELLAKLGEPPNSTHYKGILYQPLPEGRYFFDPFFYERVEGVKATIINQDEIGVLIRKYGKPLPLGKTAATEPDERGPLADVSQFLGLAEKKTGSKPAERGLLTETLMVLKPGRYNINPFAYEVKKVKPVVIPAGCVGIQTLYTGHEPGDSNQYIVKEGERGIQPNVLPPGMYYNNPYVRRIDEIDVRSHIIELTDKDAIRFPSNDSFDIVIEGTVEYAIRQDKAPYVMAAIGEHDDIKERLILPYAKSLARIEGSKILARDFVSGDQSNTRELFQKRVFEGLRRECYNQGIEIRAVMIRKIDPPQEITNLISDRQIAGQQIAQYENEIKRAESESALAEQEEMQKQSQELGKAKQEVVTVTIEADQKKAVALTDAKKRLEVAKLELDAAKAKAAAIISKGKAEADVLRLGFEAQAKPLQEAVAAFGDGETYAQFFFYQKLAPALKSVLASTDGPFADIFRALSQSSGELPAKKGAEGSRGQGVEGKNGPASSLAPQSLGPSVPQPLGPSSNGGQP